MSFDIEICSSRGLEEEQKLIVSSDNLIIASVATQGHNVIGKVVYFHLPGPRVGFYYIRHGMSGMCVCELPCAFVTMAVK